MEKEIVIPPKDEEEIALEKLVFGDVKGFESNLKKIDNLYDFSSDEEETADEEDDANDENELAHLEDDQLFFVDEGEEAHDDSNADSSDDSDTSDMDVDSDDNAWEDSDDEKLQISLVGKARTKKLRESETEVSINGKKYINRLRSQFEKIYPRPNWVDNLSEESEKDRAGEVGEDDDDMSEENNTNALLKILSSKTSYNNTSKLKLIPPTKIDITRLKDANCKHVSKSAIQSISFHPTHPLVVTGGYDRTLRIYHIDGKNNNVVTTLHLRDSPIQTCLFHPNGDKILSGGRRKYMHKWDINTGSLEKISRMYGHEENQKSMEYFKISNSGKYVGLTGNSGWCNIISGSTGQWINGVKIEGTIIDFEFSSDESNIFVINTAGEVWEFDLKNNRVKSRWNDDSGIGITKIKLGGLKDRWCAIGSNNGIVSVYDTTQMIEGKPKLVGTVENLVTTISSLEFSPDGQILSIASRAKKDALRLVHLPSCTVYNNWPTSGTPLGKVTSVAFTRNGEMICVGNEAGNARLWRLNHY